MTESWGAAGAIICTAVGKTIRFKGERVTTILMAEVAKTRLKVVRATTGLKGTVFGAMDTGGGDTLRGGLGDDFLIGGNGDEMLDGGPGFDIIFGLEGDDTLHGGKGDDVLAGWEGDDTLHGGDGDDGLGGNEGDDTLHGGEGDDIISGGDDGTDSVYGEEGDDTIRSMGGGDLLSGGAGADKFEFVSFRNSGWHEGGATIIDFNVGEDFLEFGYFRESTDIDSAGVVNGDFVFSLANGSTITLENVTVELRPEVDYVFAY